MRVCIVVEGCYPYVMGGVSSWIQSMIESQPDVEFVIQTIITSRKESGKFLFKLPPNVVSVHEIYLQDVDWVGKRPKHRRMSAAEKRALSNYMTGRNGDMQAFFRFFQTPDLSLNDLLMGEDFLDIVTEMYNERYPNLQFVDFLWTIRSMYLPLFFTLRAPPPKADFYHCVATGYAGLFGVGAKLLNGGKLLISEHGIYTREREEELIKAKWVQGMYKNVWINYFGLMSQCAYRYADKVTSLFEDVRLLQVEMGCPEEKTIVTPNGINEQNYLDIPGKDADDPYINVGAVLRIAPIKDVKTLISAFAIAKQSVNNLKLWLMGPYDEKDSYAQECFSLVRALDVKDVVFTGRIKVSEYIGKMDFLVLTSISEGQPLTILEGFAAKKPTIATNVGNCRGLILGESDTMGAAGMVLPVMSVSKIADAMVTLARDEKLRAHMGEVGYKRLYAKYTLSHMRVQYTQLYSEMASPEGRVTGCPA